MYCIINGKVTFLSFLLVLFILIPLMAQTSGVKLRLVPPQQSTIDTIPEEEIVDIGPFIKGLNTKPDTLPDPFPNNNIDNTGTPDIPHVDNIRPASNANPSPNQAIDMENVIPTKKPAPNTMPTEEEVNATPPDQKANPSPDDKVVISEDATPPDQKGNPLPNDQILLSEEENPIEEKSPDKVPAPHDTPSNPQVGIPIEPDKDELISEQEPKANKDKKTAVLNPTNPQFDGTLLSELEQQDNDDNQENKSEGLLGDGKYGVSGDEKENSEELLSSEIGDKQEDSEELLSSETGDKQEDSEELLSSETGDTQEDSEELLSSETGDKQEDSEELLSSETGDTQEDSEELLSSETGDKKEDSEELLSSKTGDKKENDQNLLSLETRDKKEDNEDLLSLKPEKEGKKLEVELEIIEEDKTPSPPENPSTPRIIDTLDGRYIQIASYKNVNSAENKALEIMANLEYESPKLNVAQNQVLIYNPNNSPYYRVLLGPLNSAEVGVTLLSVRKKGYRSAFIVSE